MAHGNAVREVAPSIPTTRGAKFTEWLKFKPLTTRRQRITALVLAVFVALLLFALYGVRLFGLTPLQGRSMEPTLGAMPFWPHLVGYYRLDREAAPEIGSLIEFRTHEAGVTVKRVTRISDDGQNIWVTTENKGITGKDSDDYGWIPMEDVNGVLTYVWTPTRAWRSMTDEGRFQNWLDLHEPDWGKKHESDGLIVYQIKDTTPESTSIIDVIRKGQSGRIARLEGQYLDWIEPQTLIYYNTDTVLMQYNITEKTTEKVTLVPEERLPWEGEMEVKKGRLGRPCTVRAKIPRTPRTAVEIDGEIWEIGFCYVNEWDINANQPGLPLTTFFLKARDGKIFEREEGTYRIHVIEIPDEEVDKLASLPNPDGS